jgi:hydroxyethylthiazole kinase-like uncharacterized protein yjeF
MHSATPLYRAASLRQIEQSCQLQPLMERAGSAAAELAQQLALHRAPTDGSPVLILAGPGNNGGDAFVVGRLLRECFFDVHLLFPGDAAQLPAEAAAAYQRYRAAGGDIITAIPEHARYVLIIDGLFGIGLSRPIDGAYAELIASANALAVRHRCPLLALDCPSGLDADSGRAGPVCIRASHTITFIAAKPGLFTADGPDQAGKVSIANLDLEPTSIASADGELVGTNAFATYLKPRKRNSHKGSYGNAGILGGAPGMLGAAFLAGRAALKLGAGRVFVGLRDPRAPGFDPQRPELMLRDAEQLLATPLTALAVGPGLGTDDGASALLSQALSFAGPLLLDADALNLLAADSSLRHELAARRQQPTLLTPHPSEAARLLACSTEEVQAERIAAACQLASHFHAHVALKGCGTIVANPDGRWRLNASGNPGLASAGSGDVLSGMAVALLAQGWDAEAALAGAVYLHGAAADALVAQGTGPLGLAADELADAARQQINLMLNY